MKLGIFIKKLSYTSGVKVSADHLCRVLNENNLAWQVYEYVDDEDLLRLVGNCDCNCINLQVPSFSDRTMGLIMRSKSNVVLSIHSTLCNLQVEDNCLDRLIEFGRKYPRLVITCPSLCETASMQRVFRCDCMYLPNTFSYETDLENIRRKIHCKADRLMRIMNQSGEKAEISLFSAYRPFKNMVTQAAAVAMLPSDFPVRLHLLDTAAKTPVYAAVAKICEDAGIETVYHRQAGNREIFNQTAEMDLGLQVSLSETFSYVAFEHMSQAVPVVGSDSVPFACCRADYSDARSIRDGIIRILSDSETYIAYSEAAYQRSMEIRRRNAIDAAACVRAMLNRSKDRG